MDVCPELEDIRAAAERIKPYAHRTPVLSSTRLNSILDADLFFKCENFQRTGSFKFRGACNAVASLSAEESARGVVTHSSGNHGQALALAAKLHGLRASIVMPRNASAVKQEAVRGYGAEVTLCEPTLEAREAAAAALIADTGGTLIHPYNDYRIIAGQGTCALELMDEISDLDVVMAPVGGGGLISGTSLAVHGVSPQTEVIAAEPKGADDAYRSFVAGHLIPADNPTTIADGLVTSLGTRTFPIIREHVAKIITVDEDAIVEAMRLVWQCLKIVVEASSAVPVAAILTKDPALSGRRVGVVLTGGNVDLDHLPWR